MDSPYPGEWIEIKKTANRIGAENVSPYTGEWIEITLTQLKNIYIRSHLTQVSGLKCIFRNVLVLFDRSHLTQVSGLKSTGH